MGNTPPPSPQGPNIWKHVQAGTTLAVTVLLCTFIGIKADKHFHSSPIGTLGGVAIGVGAGLYNFIREFLG